MKQYNFFKALYSAMSTTMPPLSLTFSDFINHAGCGLVNALMGILKGIHRIFSKRCILFPQFEPMCHQGIEGTVVVHVGTKILKDM